MRIADLPLAGAFKISIVPNADERGFFARTFCEETLASRGLVDRFRQSSVSYNHRRGTVRGLHYAAEPKAETKIVRCTAGAIYDVIVDLRRSSPTYLRSFGVELSAENRDALYIPAGFAHGFQALTDAAEVLYLIDCAYSADAARGLRWDDPAIDVAWPATVEVISDRDRTYPAWRELAAFP